MPIIKPASIQQLKARADIVEVVSAVVSLKRAGSKLKGLSPFNAEKTPSFFVSPDRGTYKCFSSGKAGDVISFVMETERLGFVEAAETLARRFNVQLEYESGGGSREERSLRQELLDLHEEAAQVYREAFLVHSPGGEFIRRYWVHERRFDLAVAEEFKIGFAEPDGGRLLERLQKKGFSPAALAQCGLFYSRGTHYPPRFRGRLMIPIRDHQGRVVAFTARQLEVTPTDDPTREAKYVNSPETPIFVKGQVLFNLDRARKAAGKDRGFLMVEGQLDAIRCWSAGLDTTIAPQGTGITDTQLRLLHRYDSRLETLLDGDAAGQRAALRLLPLALKEGLEITFLPLDEKVDPDELIRERGATAIDQLRDRQMSAMEFAVSAVAPKPDEMSAQQLADACREIFAIIENASSEIAKAEYLAEVARLLRLQRMALEADFRRFREMAARRVAPALASTSASIAAPASSTTATSPSTTDDVGWRVESSAEEGLLLLILHFEFLGKSLAETIHPDWIDESTRAGRLLGRFLNDLAHDLWPGVENLEASLDDHEDRAYVASLLFDPPLIDNPVAAADSNIRRIVSKFCGPRMKEIELEIARKAGNVDADIILLRKTITELRHLRTHPPTVRISV